MAQACEGAMLSPAEVDESRVGGATMHVKRFVEASRRQAIDGRLDVRLRIEHRNQAAVCVIEQAITRCRC